MEFKIPINEEQWRSLEGRCISCGFLGKRSLYWQEVYEANDHDRAHFSFITNTSPLPGHSGALPCCFVNYLPLSKDFRELEKKYQGAKDNGQISMEITTRDINCPKWEYYTPFMSPKEHFDRFAMQQLESDRRAFEERLDNSNKEFLAGLEHERREWEKDAGKWPKRLIWAAIILAVAEVVSNVPLIQRLLGLD